MCAPRRAAAVVRPRGREKSADRRRRILISRLLIIRASVPRRKSPFPAYFKGFPVVSPLIPPYPAFLKYPVSPHLAIILSFYTVLVELDLMVNDPAVGLHDFLGTAFNVVIGIEFLKILCRHSVGSVVEVLLFALARGLVVDHGTPVSNLITVGTIALLFVVRKFLFIPGLDDKHHQEHRHGHQNGCPTQEPAGAGRH